MSERETEIVLELRRLANVIEADPECIATFDWRAGVAEIMTADPYVHRLLTGDESWCFNVYRPSRDDRRNGAVGGVG